MSSRPDICREGGQTRPLRKLWWTLGPRQGGGRASVWKVAVCPCRSPAAVLRAKADPPFPEGGRELSPPDRLWLKPTRAWPLRPVRGPRLEPGAPSQEDSVLPAPGDLVARDRQGGGRGLPRGVEPTPASLPARVLLGDSTLGTQPCPQLDSEWGRPHFRALPSPFLPSPPGPAPRARAGQRATPRGRGQRRAAELAVDTVPAGSPRALRPVRAVSATRPGAFSLARQAGGKY